jgi:hypothetical protein
MAEQLGAGDVTFGELPSGGFCGQGLSTVQC